MLGDSSWLSQDPYDLVSGTRSLAKMCGVNLGGKASSDEIQNKLWPIWGSEPGFESAIPEVARALKLDGASVPNDQALCLLEATGLLDAFGLRTVIGFQKPTRPLVYLMLGTTTNWTPRRINLFLELQEQGIPYGGLFLLANGARECKLKTELVNPDVIAFQAEHGRLPNEAEFLVLKVNELIGRRLERVHYDAPRQEEQVTALFTEFPALAQGAVCVVVNANATFVPLQVRRVIRELWPTFDANYDQFYFIQDGFPLARTPEEAEDAANYQRPLTVFPGLVRLLTELHQLQETSK